jgi:nucleotide-binding universal stress UspA family protein
MDGSSLAECVLPHVVAIAKTFQARVTLLQVQGRSKETGPFVDPLGWQMGKLEAKNYLERINTHLRQSGLQTESKLINGQAANGIIEFAHDSQANLIILSSHGRSGLSVWNVSSVVRKIIQRAYLPTMIVRAYQAPEESITDLNYKRIMIPLDSSQRAECAIPISTRLARYYKAQLLVTHVVSQPEMPRRTPLSKDEITLIDQLIQLNKEEATKYLQQIKNRLKSKDIDVQTHLLLRDDVASALHEVVEQEDVDMVILSAHGYSGKTKWPYGNVVEKFITYGSTPLLIYQDFMPDDLEQTQAETMMEQLKGH